jgi:hypothetical protein
VPQIVEGAITFDFPVSFEVQKLDVTTFYKKHFQSFAGGAKAVDIIAFDSSRPELWLIEVKDYRAHRRIKTMDLFDEIATKVFSSLTCLLAMRANAIGEEQAFAVQALKQFRLKVVLHLEQPSKPSKFFPQVIDPKAAPDKLKQRLRAIDPQAKVSSIALARVPWVAT